MTYKIRTCETPLKNAMESGKVIAEGHVQLPAITPGETGKARFTLPASFREGDVLELEAFDKEGKSICNWTYPIRLAKQYFDHKMAQTPMTLEAVQPATATQTATSIELKSDRVTVTFDPATGMISRIISGGTEVPFKDGPVAVGMKMRYEPTLSYVRNSNEGAVYCAKYKGAADSIVWRLTDKGLLYMDAILLNRASGGGGFDDAFMDSKVFNLGLTFSYPEKNCSGMKWMGRGPYRVWKTGFRERIMEYGTKSTTIPSPEKVLKIWFIRNSKDIMPICIGPLWKVTRHRSPFIHGMTVSSSMCSLPKNRKDA